MIPGDRDDVRDPVISTQTPGPLPPSPIPLRRGCAISSLFSCHLHSPSIPNTPLQPAFQVFLITNRCITPPRHQVSSPSLYNQKTMASAAPRILPSLLRRATSTAAPQLRAVHTFARTTPRAPTARQTFPLLQKRFVAGAPRGGELPTGSGKNPFPVYPLIALFLVGSGAFYFIVEDRKGMPVYLSNLWPGWLTGR
jgi:hypothetical protein